MSQCFNILLRYMYCTCRAQCLCLTAISFACKISLFHCAPSCPSAAIDVSSTKDMLAAMYRLYQSSHLMSTIKKILFKFFTSLVFDEDHLLLRNDNVSTVLEKWLQSLPRMLVQLKASCPEMTSLVLKVMAIMLWWGNSLKAGEKSLCQCWALFFGKANFSEHIEVVGSVPHTLHCACFSILGGRLGMESLSHPSHPPTVL